MTFFEVSPLCNFNVIESFTELSRIVLMRHGMEKFWRPNRGQLFDLCFSFYIVSPEPNISCTMYGNVTKMCLKC